MDSARIVLNSTQSTFDDMTLLPVLYEYYVAEVNYNKTIQNYRRGLDYIDKVLSTEARKVLLQKNIIDIQIIKSEILHEQGKNTEAYNLLNTTYYKCS